MIIPLGLVGGKHPFEINNLTNKCKQFKRDVISLAMLVKTIKVKQQDRRLNKWSRQTGTQVGIWNDA